MWAKYLGDKAQGRSKGIGVSGDPGLLEAVIKDPLGIGYNNLNYAFDTATGMPVAGAVVVPVDVNGNGQVDEAERLDSKAMAIQAVDSGAYPHHLPARCIWSQKTSPPAQHWTSSAGFWAMAKSTFLKQDISS